MALKPDASVMVGLATGAVVYGIYVNALPPIADVRSVPENEPNVDAAERTAAWMSAAVVSGISLITRDMTVFIIGGSLVIALSWWNKHASMTIPELAMAVPKYAREELMVNEEGMQEAEQYDYAMSE